jgi:hypothetical protein
VDRNVDKKRTAETVLSRNPSGYVHIVYMALNLISLWSGQDLLAVGILYHKKIKKRTRPRRVTGAFLNILYQIKKAPANARASTTTTMMSLLWSEGR